MAVPITITALEAALADRAPEYLANGLAEKGMLYSRFRKTPPSDPKGPRWNVISTANSSAGSFVDGADSATPQAMAATQASLRWGNYRAHFKLSDRQIKQLSEGSAEQLFSVVDENLMHMERQVIDNVESDILTGSTDNQTIIGLSTAIANANTYAGVDRSSVTAFASPQANGGGDTITAADMLSAWNNLHFTNLGRATVGFCSNGILDVIRGFSTGNVASSVYVTNQEAQTGIGKFIQYNKVFFKDIPIIAVPGMASTLLYFLDEEDVTIEQLGGWELKEVERQGLNYVFTMVGYLQMKIRNPFKSTALVTNVTT